MKIKKKSDSKYTTEQLTEIMNQVLGDIQLGPHIFASRYADFEFPEEIFEAALSLRGSTNVLSYVVAYVAEHELEKSSTVKHVAENVQLLMEFLLQNSGWDDEVQLTAANEALLIAAKYGCVLCMHLLLQWCADPMALNAERKTAIDLVFEESAKNMDEFQLSYYLACAVMLAEDDSDNGLLKFMCKKFKDHPLSKMVAESEVKEKQDDLQEKITALAGENKTLKSRLDESDNKALTLEAEVEDLRKQLQGFSQQLQQQKQEHEQQANVSVHANKKKGLFGKFG